MHATTPATDEVRQPLHAAVPGPHAASTGDDDDEVSEVGSLAADTCNRGGAWGASHGLSLSLMPWQSGRSGGRAGTGVRRTRSISRSDI